MYIFLYLYNYTICITRIYMYIVVVQRGYILYVYEQLYNEDILCMYMSSCTTIIYYICTGATVQRVYIMYVQKQLYKE